MKTTVKNKITLAAMTALMVFAFAGCGQKSTDTTTPPAAPNAPATPPPAMTNSTPPAATNNGGNP